MRYEIIYSDENDNYCKEVTEQYTIFQINDDNTLMRCYYDTGIAMLFPPSEKWFEYAKTSDGWEHDLTEEDAFLLCL